MLQYIYGIFGAMTFMIILDAPWLYIMSQKLYSPYLGHLLAPNPNFIAAAVFYIIYAMGLNFFVVQPLLLNNSSFLYFFIYGAFFGMVAYATYDLTNHATMKDWPLLVTVVDIIWGAFLTGLVSVLTGYLLRKLAVGN